MFDVTFMLAQVTLQMAGRILLWAGLLVVLVIVMFVAALLLRRRLLGQDDTTVDRGTFSMAELRDLRDQGKLSESEYQRAKQTLVANQLARLQSNEPPPDSDNGSSATKRP